MLLVVGVLSGATVFFVCNRVRNDVVGMRVAFAFVVFGASLPM